MNERSRVLISSNALESFAAQTNLYLKAGNLSSQMRINASVVATVQLTRFWLYISLRAKLLASDMGAAMLSVCGTNRGCLPPFTKTVVSGLTAVRVVV